MQIELSEHEIPEHLLEFFEPIEVSQVKPKDLMGIPWRVAFALQADGWFLRLDGIWAKGVSFCPTYSGSCMPESVRDRPTKGHEYVFLLSKQKRYYYDGDAVRENFADERMGNPGQYEWRYSLDSGRQDSTAVKGTTNWNADKTAAGRNLRSVWTINPGSYAGAHFATFPPKLVEPMIKAGTSAKGCCPECGAAWERVTERERPPEIERSQGAKRLGMVGRNDNERRMGQQLQDWYSEHPTTTTGWIPTCSCYGVEIPDKLRLPDEPEDARPPFVCEQCGGTGLEPSLPLLPGLDVPCRKCKGKGEKPANDVWLAWQAECEEVQANRRALLDNIRGLDLPVEPCAVCDIFLGSGTTAEVAIRLGRRTVGVELSQAYCDEHIIPRLEKPIQVQLL